VAAARRKANDSPERSATLPAAADPAAWPRTRVTKRREVPGAAWSGTRRPAQEMSAEVAATNPQPKTAHAATATTRSPATSPSAAVAAATLAAVSSQARAGCNLLTRGEVRADSVPPPPSAIQARMEPASLVPSATSWIRP
jgi:hypothetical protein